MVDGVDKLDILWRFQVFFCFFLVPVSGWFLSVVGVHLQGAKVGFVFHTFYILAMNLIREINNQLAR